VSGAVEWLRRWMYDLVWQDGHAGVRSGSVDTVAQLREVVHWAQANPRVRRWSIRPVDALIGDPPTRCRQGHPLLTALHPNRMTGWLPCTGCGGHVLLVCDCGDRVIAPVPGPDCGPPPGWSPPRR
jgi:hypothetical protein